MGESGFSDHRWTVLDEVAMYGAMAVGGVAEQAGGFSAVSRAVVLMPLLGAALALALPGVSVVVGHRTSFLRVLSAIWPEGAGLALASSGFGTIAAFLALRYQAQGWPGPGLALTGFGARLISSCGCCSAACPTGSAAGLLLI